MNATPVETKVAEAQSFHELLRRPSLPALDGSRAIAVGTVMAFHFGSERGVPGDLGVTLFFVLSGFLITTLLQREVEATGRISLRDFYVRRVLRIFPAYYAYLAAVGVLMLVTRREWPQGQGWSALVFMTDYYDALVADSSSSIAHLWSIGIEEKFYLLWPAALAALAMKGRRAMAAALVTTILAVALWRCVGLLVLDGTIAYAYHAFDTRADSLAIGCLIAVLLTTARGATVAEALSARWWFPLATIALLLFVRLPVSDANRFHYSIGFTLEAALCGLLLVQLMRLSQGSAWGWLEHPVTRFLGRISYPLYLYHLVVWLAIRTLDPPGLVAYPLMVLGSIAVASASYYVVERPFLKLKRRFEAVTVAAAR